MSIVCRSWAALVFLVFALLSVCYGYSERLEDKTEMRQSCSGVWAGPNTSIDGSSGLVTTIIYEISEFSKIGKYDPSANKYGHITYLCTPTAQQRGLCKPEQLNLYVIDDESSVWSIKQEKMDFGERLMETKAMNRFAGHLPAAEHPKFYIVMVQHFVSGVLLFLVIEMACQWLFYRYYNTYPVDLRHFDAADGRPGVTSIARFLLVFTNILESVRDSMSFFLLLIVSYVSQSNVQDGLWCSATDHWPRHHPRVRTDRPALFVQCYVLDWYHLCLAGHDQCLGGAIHLPHGLYSDGLLHVDSLVPQKHHPRPA
ncbi:hypothetical protein MCAP1_000356a, partial [Malassezia caprae]